MTPQILAEIARDDLRASLERLHALDWRLVTTGADTVQGLTLVHLTTGARLPVWSAPTPVPDRERLRSARPIPPVPPHPRSAGITRRRLEQLEAVVAAARDLLDVTDPDSFDGRGMCAVVLADRLDDLDAYCERCDDEGVIVRVLGGEPTSPPPVTETPCECESARILAAKRADERRASAPVGFARCHEPNGCRWRGSLDDAKRAGAAASEDNRRRGVTACPACGSYAIGEHPEGRPADEDERDEPCLDCLSDPCWCALDEAGDLEDQIDHLLDEEPARA